jgi:hypothetical protein
MMGDAWNDIDEWNATPFRERYPSLRDRARRRLEVSRKKLPRMTKEQTETIIDMMVGAYVAGECETAQCHFNAVSEEMTHRAQKAVIARRMKSKRLAIIEAFKKAAAQRKDVSIEQLAKEHGVSRATAYRALAMTAPRSKK